jgi:hypothetical protein
MPKTHLKHDANMNSKIEVNALIQDIKCLLDVRGSRLSLKGLRDIAEEHKLVVAKIRLAPRVCAGESMVNLGVN